MDIVKPIIEHIVYPLMEKRKGNKVRQYTRDLIVSQGLEQEAMGAVREGLREDELPAIVNQWRRANPQIVGLWGKLERCFIDVVKRMYIEYKMKLPYTKLYFYRYEDFIFIELPSGRHLSYYMPDLSRGRLSYTGLNQVNKQWGKIDTYGGSLTENIVQAIARDCLCEALQQTCGIANIITHIHDEIIYEVNEEYADLAFDEILKAMAVSPPWAPSLPLRADGFISNYYKKD